MGLLRRKRREQAEEQEVRAWIEDLTAFVASRAEKTAPLPVDAAAPAEITMPLETSGVQRPAPVDTGEPVVWSWTDEIDAFVAEQSGQPVGAPAPLIIFDEAPASPAPDAVEDAEVA